MAETLTLRGTLKGHTNWVTAIATPLDPASNTILSASRCVYRNQRTLGRNSFRPAAKSFPAYRA